MFWDIELSYLCLCISEACEYSIKDSGEFFSPNYSSPYEPNIICEWRLSVPKSRIARLTIVDMNIEETDECLFDRIIVHDGRNKKSPVIGTLCGDRVNDIVINATGILYKINELINLLPNR